MHSKSRIWLVIAEKSTSQCILFLYNREGFDVWNFPRTTN